MPTYEMIACGFGIVVVGALFLLFIFINLQLARNYIIEEHKRVLPFDPNICDGGDYGNFVGAFLVVCLLAVLFAFIWPIYVVAAFSGTTYGILRCIRYFVRKRKQFVKVANFLHKHPDSVQHEAVEIQDVDF